MNTWSYKPSIMQASPPALIQVGAERQSTALAVEEQGTAQPGASVLHWAGLCCTALCCMATAELHCSTAACRGWEDVNGL